MLTDKLKIISQKLNNNQLLGSKPAFKRHDSVMVDMEEREMGELFLGNKEEGVKHVKKLGHVKQPGQIQGPEIKQSFSNFGNSQDFN